MKVKKGDRVIVITGKDRSKEGIVLKADPSKKRVKVEGIAMRSRHLKASAKNQEGGIVKSEGFIDVSNVLLIDNKAKNKRSRVGYRMENNKKVRFLKRSKSSI